MPNKLSQTIALRATEMTALYRSGKTLAEIGARYSLTRERVRQILAAVGVSPYEGGQYKRTRATLNRLEQAVIHGESLSRAVLAEGYNKSYVSRLSKRIILPESTLVRLRGQAAREREARFWAKVDKRGPNECWPWTGPINSERGYGITSRTGARYAHRQAFVYSGGVLIHGLVVMHRCDNPPCCNPAHLRQATQRDNVHDAMDKGRRHKSILTPEERRNAARLSCRKYYYQKKAERAAKSA